MKGQVKGLWRMASGRRAHSCTVRPGAASTVPGMPSSSACIVSLV